MAWGDYSGTEATAQQAWRDAIVMLVFYAVIIVIALFAGVLAGHFLWV